MGWINQRDARLRALRLENNSSLEEANLFQSPFISISKSLQLTNTLFSNRVSPKGRVIISNLAITYL